MPLAELSAINLVSPLLITAAAVIFFGEQVGWRRWMAIAVGFLGTLLVIKPIPSAFNAWALLGVATAFVRRGARHDHASARPRHSERRRSPSWPRSARC